MVDVLLAAAEPTFDSAFWIALFSRVAHTTCGATLLGGLIYLRFVLAPAAAEAQDPELVAFVGRRRAWAICVMICSLLLIVSGLYNLMLFMGAYQNLPKLYHPLFGAKFLLALAVMAISALVAGRSGLAKKMRGSMRGWLNLAIVLALAIFVISATLRSFRDLPDARSASVDAAPEGMDMPTIDLGGE